MNQQTGVQGTGGRTPLLGMGAIIGIAAGLGLFLGILLDNLVLWMLIGAALGTVAGAAVESGRR